ncbi:TPA: fimbria/pilus periplasmic chaperone [Citrobacter freundii]|nr:fimbria/pilus periplasmic chaperone [Citrobacter freundii]
MNNSSLRKSVVAGLFAVFSLMPVLANAGGIVLSGTRLIYPAETKQTSVSVRNTSKQSNFLVQSWVEDANGQKSTDFIVTPPLYVSGPENENTLRIMYAGKPLPGDKETLYYFNAKAIPSIDKSKMKGENMLLLSAVTRIKLFVRPQKLNVSVSDAPADLVFYRDAGMLQIKNPTPYYITLAKLKAGSVALKDIMVPPGENTSQPFPANGGNNLTYQTINDYGALTPERHVSL